MRQRSRRATIAARCFGAIPVKLSLGLLLTCVVQQVFSANVALASPGGGRKARRGARHQSSAARHAGVALDLGVRTAALDGSSPYDSGGLASMASLHRLGAPPAGATYQVPGGAAAATGKLAAKAAAAAAAHDAAAASKWSLSAAATTPTLPTILQSGLDAGPLNDAEVQELVALLTRSTQPASAAVKPTDAANGSLFGQAAEADLTALQTELDALVPVADGSAPRPIDGDALHAWFQALDTSKDSAISFLEWRDQTGLPLDVFRRMDASNEGLVSFDEFARPLLINGSKLGRALEPQLLDWALDRQPSGDGAAAPAGSVPTNVEALDDKALLARARSLVAAAIDLRASAADAKTKDADKGTAKKDDAKKGEGKKSEGKKARDLTAPGTKEPSPVKLKPKAGDESAASSATKTKPSTVTDH